MKKIMYLLLWILSQKSPLLFAQQTPEEKPWLQQLPADLYEQPFLQSQNYKELTKEQKESYKLKHFSRRKLSSLTNKAIAWGVSSVISTFLLGGGIAWGLQNLDKIEKYSQVSAPITIMFLSIYIPVILPGTFSALKNRFWGRPYDPLQPLEEKYILRKELLPLGLRIEIEKQFNLAHIDPSHTIVTKFFTDLAFKLPKKNIKIDFVQKKIDKSFEGYDPLLREQVEAFCLRQVMMQTDKKDTKFRQGKRMAAYFQGLPGGGKTRFAELIAEVLELPFARVSLEGATISDLVGRSLNSGNSCPGLLIEAMTNAQFNNKRAKNMILFIDEADRVINNSKSETLPFLLKLLDPESKSFFNPYLNTEVDISNLIIILAGNYAIKDKALRKRLQIVHFKGFTAEFKKNIIWNTILEKMCKSYSRNGKYSITLSEFTSEDRETINKLIEMDKDKGFRTIENILMDYLDYKVKQKYFNKNAAFPSVFGKTQLLNLEYQKKMPNAVAA